MNFNSPNERGPISLFVNNLKLLSKRCHEAFWNLKTPVFMHLFSVYGIIPTRLRVLSHSYFSPYFGTISVRFFSFCFVFLCILCVFSPFGTVLVSKFGINFLKNRRRKNVLFFCSNDTFLWFTDQLALMLGRRCLFMGAVTVVLLDEYVYYSINYWKRPLWKSCNWPLYYHWISITYGLLITSLYTVSEDSNWHSFSAHILGMLSVSQRNESLLQIYSTNGVITNGTILLI